MNRAQKLRVLQVGLGDWGRDWAWRINPTVDQVEVVGYVDSDPAAFELLQRKLPSSEGQTFTAFSTALAKTKPDAVLVTTTLASHAALIAASLEAGLHVLVEKPFAETLDSAMELVALAASKRRVLMVSQNYRFFPAPRAVVTLMRDGELGELYAVSIDFRRNSASPPRTRWRQHWDPQPLLVDMSVHHFDLLRFLFGREPDRMSCVTAGVGRGGFDGPPMAFASIAFGDVPVSYRGSWISSGPFTAWAGEWVMEFEQGQVTWTSRGDEGAVNDRVAIRRRGGQARSIKLPEFSRVDRAGTLTEFAAAIRDEREPETSGRDNLGTMAMVGAAVESAPGGDWVRVSSVRD
ncbi:MAG TPA: Gfo/Idh/MocA family oxidoreductase [Candidatus Dormibacteraeota bacterium]|nr:Gfo/Idh/MocA family oxidoreductase [Candidatus Dormibacteraeota bacterium]